jgi:hypothetical protein
LVTCFAGCESGDIIHELRRRGLLENPERYFRASRVERPVEHKPDPAALEIWNGGKRSEDSIVEKYLRGRGINIPIPPSIRAIGSLAMAAAVQAPDGRVIAVQVTGLTRDARRVQTPVPRITTGALGLGAVRYAKASDVLGIAEGVETALSAMQLSEVPCWAAIGAARMHRIWIPDCVREVHIFGDNDEPGRAAAERTAHVYATRKVVLRFPPHSVKDWNDFLRASPGRAA